ncbi:hypothetical protein GGI25_002004 [Coemansia spiralis]|uniref:F-box domain-containing protein n=2 Tax=Coemansia TaxID=4863 RepID=A0A9W8G9S3_9FUNG|nr:hypothetical protein GGI25_002004 [Coemansia spiralis]
MHICLLADDILILVLRYATGGYSYGLRGWRRKLGLLSVCKRWRAISLSMLSREVYMECVGNDGAVTTTDYVSNEDKHAKIRHSDIIPVSVKSNLALLALYTNYYSPRKLSISVTYSLGLELLTLYLAIELLGKYAGYIGKVTELQLDFVNMSSPGQTYRQQCETPNVADLASRVTQVLPGIRAYRLGITRMDYHVLKFGHLLTKHYVEYLDRLECSSMLAFPYTGFSGKHLFLRTNSMMHTPSRKPMVNPRELERLYFTRLVEDFDWRVFLGQNEPMRIVFEELKHLGVEVSVSEVITGGSHGDKAGDMGRFSIAAPKLESWSTEMCPLGCRLLSTVLLSMPLKVLHFDCMNGTEITLQNVDVENKGKNVFSSYVTRNDGGDIAFVEFANSILDVPGLAEYASVTMSQPLQHTEIRRINWAYVTSVEIKSRITLDQLLVLVSRLPRLVDLKAYNVELPVEVESFRWYDLDNVFNGLCVRTIWIELFVRSSAVVPCGLVGRLHSLIPTLKTANCEMNHKPTSLL